MRQIILTFMVVFVFSIPTQSASLLNYLQTLPKVSLQEVKSSNVQKSNVLKTAKTYLGVKYRWGGNNKKGIDCSGFTKTVFKTHDMNLPRTARQQFKLGEKITKKEGEKGDLIFFSDSKRSIGHVGIILDPEKKLMIHASSGAKKVTITSYDKQYYKNHYKGIRRI